LLGHFTLCPEPYGAYNPNGDGLLDRIFPSFNQPECFVKTKTIPTIKGRERWHSAALGRSFERIDGERS